MKRILISLIFFTTFTLCSCRNTLPEEMSTEESTLPEEMSTEGSTDAEAMSIVFMEEYITAPSSYPDVPDVYTPVLDDLYLYGELLHRYETLNYEGKVTQEILRECEEVQDEIQQRGYISDPYGGIEGTSGYALADLDGDNSPELLLLDNSSRDSGKQTPVIYSIFAVRNGQLICIENDSFELQYDTILAADSTFYRVDCMSTGEIYLSSFRLEAERLKFTKISEAHAMLSFSDGDVPIPYWVKKENGKEINITEGEFDILFEQYNNPKELMILDFVPLHPGAVDVYSAPRPADESSAIPIEYPQSYQDAPSAYKPILDDLYLFFEYLRRGESIDDAWGETGFVELPGDELGYAVIDLNNDGIPELLLGSINGLNNSAPHSVFTLKSGKPVLLTSFGSRDAGVILADGTIYCIGSGGAAYTYLSSFRLDKNADALTELTDIHSDYSDSEGKPYFVQVVDGKNHYITEKEFRTFWEEYENPSETMQLTVTPIAD